jgi:hypothetical protein
MHPRQNCFDYAMLIKIYGSDPDGEKRYSPTVCTGCKKENKIGDPDRHMFLRATSDGRI